MSSPQPKALSAYLAEDVHREADRLVEAWIAEIMEHGTLRPARMLPKEAIRDHIPQVIRGIADSLRTPSDITLIDGAIRSHARLRFDQGFDIEELFLEYRGLTRLVTDRMMLALERFPGQAEPLEVARIFSRLSQGLAMISERTAGTYRQTEARNQRELHSQLEDYIRTITHELKQPLNAITAGAGMLEEQSRDRLDDRGADYLRVIRNGIERAVTLIDEIRTLALVEQSQQSDAWAPLASSVSVVLRQVSDLARAEDVRIEVPNPLPSIDVDATRFEIAFVNLMTNAIKYADPDEDDRWVRVGAEPVEPDETHLWRIDVEDNGLGIPEAMHPQIFERHFRAHPDVGEGTGLGLAISRQVIEQVGGDIWFESEPGRGSTFHFTVPGHLNEAAPSDEAQREDSAVPEEAVASESTSDPSDGP
jgi:signal transduction histidine kinase